MCVVNAYVCSRVKMCSDLIVGAIICKKSLNRNATWNASSRIAVSPVRNCRFAQIRFDFRFSTILILRIHEFSDM